MILDSKKPVNCIKCGDYAHKVMIVQNRGYGSELDCFEENTFIPVCPKCARELKDEWFYEPSIIEGGYCETYPNEYRIVEFINSTALHV